MKLIGQMGGKLEVQDQGSIIAFLLEVPTLTKQQFDDLSDKMKAQPSR